MPSVRLAVVGVGAQEGSRARGYLETIARLKDLYTLCALCDHSPESLQAAGDRFGVIARYTDVEKMIRSERPDVVFVLVPTDGQTAVALTAARLRCHVITEIPYALTLGFGDAIAQACRESDVRWEVAENVWLWPRERLKQEVVASGMPGKLTHARLRYPCGSYHGINAVRMILGSEPWRALGYAQSVEVPPYTSYGGQPETAKWWESGTIEFGNGVTCLYEMAPSPGARDRHWEIEGWEGYLSGDGISSDELVLYQDRGAAHYPFLESYEEVAGERVLASVWVDTDPPVMWHNPFKEYKISNFDDIAKASILCSMYRAVAEGIDLAYGGENARRDMELWIALRESAQRGNAWMNLPLREETGLEKSIRAEYIRRYGGDPVTDTAALLKASFNRLSVMWTVAGWL